ncbi:hypothetical protein ACI2OX_03705 [Bacillus sp. N9]
MKNQSVIKVSEDELGIKRVQKEAMEARRRGEKSLSILRILKIVKQK